jgi:hypothetical protein
VRIVIGIHNPRAFRSNGSCLCQPLPRKASPSTARTRYTHKHCLFLSWSLMEYCNVLPMTVYLHIPPGRPRLMVGFQRSQQPLAIPRRRPGSGLRLSQGYSPLPIIRKPWMECMASSAKVTDSLVGWCPLIQYSNNILCRGLWTNVVNVGPEPFTCNNEPLSYTPLLFFSE